MAVLSLVVAACSSSSGSSIPPAGPSTIVPVENGGTLTYANADDITSFNVNTREGRTFVDQLVMDRVWPQTFIVNPGFKPVLDPAFVQSAELVSTGPQTIVYKINPRAVWSDGVPINADDFVYNWKAQAGGGTDVSGQPYDVVSSAGYSDIRSVTGSDNGKTVTVVFKQPYADWESLFANLVPAHIAERVGWNTGFNSFNPSNVVSGGPFEVTSYVPGSELVLSRNPHYWGAPARLDHIVFRLIPDESQDPVALGNDEVNMIYPQPQRSVVQEVKRLPGNRHGSGVGMSYEHLDFNEANRFLSDVVVRRSIALSIDRKQLVKKTVNRVNPTVTPDNNRFFVNNQAGYQDNAAGYERADVPTAQRQLESDGYQMEPSGYLAKDGRTLDLRLLTVTSDPLGLEVADQIQADLKAAGIEVDVTSADPDTAMQALRSGSYDMALYSTMNTPFPSETAAVFGTASMADAGEGMGTQNWTGFSDPAVDKLFEQASGELDQPKAFDTYNQIDKMLWSEMVTLPLYQEPTFLAYSKKYANISDNGSWNGPFWDAEVWGLRAEPGS